MFTGFARGIGYLTMIAVVGGLLTLAVGFGWFVLQIPDEEIQLNNKADGIVVLTGAASRIPDAIVLLNNQSGKRLLITGVHRTTSAREIAQLMALNEKVFACCIDLDRSALNTLGNAIEAKRWARERGFQFSDCRHFELAHAARDGRARASIAGRDAHSVSGRFGKS